MSDDTVADELRRLGEGAGLKLDEAPEIYGPTDINAQSSNGRLAVGINDAGTVTVVRWPRPSFYDQIKYHTRRRDAERFGVAPNEGAFLGVRIDGTTEWVRDWATSQRYADPLGDTVVTEHRSDEHGLAVTVRDVVARERDVLAREVEVEAAEAGAEPPDSAELVAFENLNLVVSKDPESPVQDWAREGENDDTARYDPDADAIVHGKRGVDGSTGRERSVAVAMGFRGTSDAHHVGGDAHEPAATAPPPVERDAFEAASAGVFPGNDRFEGQTTGVLTRALDLASGDGAAGATLLFAAAPEPEGATGTLATARDRADGARRTAKRAWIEGLVGDAPLPATDDTAVRAVARRALVTLVTNYDPDSGALVASIATQAPYNLDWVRDGAYFNHALDRLGLHDWAETRARWYADLQQSIEDYHLDQAGTPPGNWAMNYYADGVPGGPIAWEIDETGYGVWTLWDHYRATGDEAYLADVYPAIRRAANFLAAYEDPDTGLHLPAHEDDNVVPSQTVVGAGAVHLGLDAAAAAAAALDRDDDAARYRRRRDRLAAAIDDHLWDEAEGAYSAGRPDLERSGGIPLVPGADAEPTLGWPIGFPGGDRMDRHLERVWETIAPTFDEPAAGERAFGQYEVKGLISLARAWRGDERMERVREGVRWVAREHATGDTRHMGELWLREDGGIATSMSQPHTWEQLLFYYAALEAFPPEGVDVGPDAESGVIERLGELS